MKLTIKGKPVELSLEMDENDAALLANGVPVLWIRDRPEGAHILRNSVRAEWLEGMGFKIHRDIPQLEYHGEVADFKEVLRGERS